jgi:D-alanyl-D-alanine carboxypeptidase
MTYFFQATILASIFGIFLVLPISPFTEIVNEQPLIEQLELETKSHIPPIVIAKSALAVDLTTGEILFEKSSEKILPLASITKLISLLVVLDYIDPNEIVTISLNAILTPEPSGFFVGQQFFAKDLIALTLVSSSNDSITALLEHAAEKNSIIPEKQNAWFLHAMNNKTETLGAHGNVFYNATGLDISDSLAGSYSSASNLLKIINGSTLSPLWQYGTKREITSLDGKIYNLTPTNKLDFFLPNLIGAKTGFTDLAGGNLFILIEYPLTKPIAIIVLGSTEEDRFTDVKKIFTWIKEVKP